MLSTEEIKEIEAHIKDYPQKRAACIEALKVVQNHRRWISDESLKDIAELLEMTSHELDSVATFYNLVFRKPVGEHIILLCDSISCYIMGYKNILNHLNKTLEINFGESTEDNRFTMLPNPCLGTCDHAPALMIDNELYKDLTTESLNEILEKYK